MRRNIYAVVVTLAFVILTVSGAAALMRGIPDANAIQTVHAIAQPPSAADVARELGCVSFKHYPVKNDGSHTPLVVDAGTCWIDGNKLAINTFVSKANRDAWIKLAESEIGIIPKWETETSVTYPSLHTATSN